MSNPLRPPRLAPQPRVLIQSTLGTGPQAEANRKEVDQTAQVVSQRLDQQDRQAAIDDRERQRQRAARQQAEAEQQQNAIESAVDIAAKRTGLPTVKAPDGTRMVLTPTEQEREIEAQERLKVARTEQEKAEKASAASVEAAKSRKLAEARFESESKKRDLSAVAKEYDDSAATIASKYFQDKDTDPETYSTGEDLDKIKVIKARKAAAESAFKGADDAAFEMSNPNRPTPENERLARQIELQKELADHDNEIKSFSASQSEWEANHTAKIDAIDRAYNEARAAGTTPRKARELQTQRAVAMQEAQSDFILRSREFTEKSARLTAHREGLERRARDVMGAKAPGASTGQGPMRPQEPQNAPTLNASPVTPGKQSQPQASGNIPYKGGMFPADLAGEITAKRAETQSATQAEIAKLSDEYAKGAMSMAELEAGTKKILDTTAKVSLEGVEGQVNESWSETMLKAATAAGPKATAEDIANRPEWSELDATAQALGLPDGRAMFTQSEIYRTAGQGGPLELPGLPNAVAARKVAPKIPEILGLVREYVVEDRKAKGPIGAEKLSAVVDRLGKLKFESPEEVKAALGMVREQLGKEFGQEVGIGEDIERSFKRFGGSILNLVKRDALNKEAEATEFWVSGKFDAAKDLEQPLGKVFRGSFPGTRKATEEEVAAIKAKSAEMRLQMDFVEGLKNLQEAELSPSDLGSGSSNPRTNLLKKGVKVALDSAPYMLAPMTGPVGIAATAASFAGQRMEELEKIEAQTGQRMTAFEKLADSVVVGGVQGAVETYLGKAARMIPGVGGAASGALGKVGRTFATSLMKRWGLKVIEESAEEVVQQVTPFGVDAIAEVFGSERGDVGTRLQDNLGQFAKQSPEMFVGIMMMTGPVAIGQNAQYRNKADGKLDLGKMMTVPEIAASIETVGGASFEQLTAAGYKPEIAAKAAGILDKGARYEFLADQTADLSAPSAVAAQRNIAMSKPEGRVFTAINEFVDQTKPETVAAAIGEPVGEVKAATRLFGDPRDADRAGLASAVGSITDPATFTATLASSVAKTHERSRMQVAAARAASLTQNAVELAQVNREIVATGATPELQARLLAVQSQMQDKRVAAGLGKILSGQAPSDVESAAIQAKSAELMGEPLVIPGKTSAIVTNTGLAILNGITPEVAALSTMDETEAFEWDENRAVAMQRAATKPISGVGTPGAQADAGKRETDGTSSGVPSGSPAPVSLFTYSATTNDGRTVSIDSPTQLDRMEAIAALQQEDATIDPKTLARAENSVTEGSQMRDQAPVSPGGETGQPAAQDDPESPADFAKRIAPKTAGLVDVFPGGVRDAKDGELGNSPMGYTRGKLVINRDRLALYSPEQAETLVKHELIHHAMKDAIREGLFSDADVAGLWNSLGESTQGKKLQRLVRNAYFSTRGEAKNAEASDFAMGSEMIRMVVEDAEFAGQISEAVIGNADATMTLRKILRALRKFLAKAIKQLGDTNPDLRAELEFMAERTAEVLRELKTEAAAIEANNEPALFASAASPSGFVLRKADGNPFATEASAKTALTKAKNAGKIRGGKVVAVEGGFEVLAGGLSEAAKAEVKAPKKKAFGADLGKMLARESESELKVVAKEEGQRSEITSVPVVEFPVARLKLSKDVPNFKEDADPETGVVRGDRLEGKVDRRGMGPVIAWKRLNGDVEIISGRHRLDLFRRNGEKTIPTQIFKESDGFTKFDARVLDAELNIRDGQGSIADYADYFRNARVTREEAQARGLLSRAKGRAGFAIGRDGSADLYALHASGKITDAKAAAIAEAAPGDTALQAVGIRYAGELSPEALTQLIGATRNTNAQGQQGDMFGFDDANLNSAVALVKESQKRIREIDEQIRAVKGAARNPQAARKLGVDVRDPAAVQSRIEVLEADKARFQRFYGDPATIAELRGETSAKPIDFRDKDFLDATGQDSGFRLTGQNTRGTEFVEPDSRTQSEIDRDAGQGDLLTPSEQSFTAPQADPVTPSQNLLMASAAVPSSMVRRFGVTQESDPFAFAYLNRRRGRIDTKTVKTRADLDAFAEAEFARRSANRFQVEPESIRRLEPVIRKAAEKQVKYGLEEGRQTLRTLGAPDYRNGIPPRVAKWIEAKKWKASLFDAGPPITKNQYNALIGAVYFFINDPVATDLYGAESPTESDLQYLRDFVETAFSVQAETTDVGWSAWVEQNVNRPRREAAEAWAMAIGAPVDDYYVKQGEWGYEVLSRGDNRTPGTFDSRKEAQAAADKANRELAESNNIGLTDPYARNLAWDILEHSIGSRDNYGLGRPRELSPAILEATLETIKGGEAGDPLFLYDEERGKAATKGLRTIKAGEGHRWVFVPGAGGASEQSSKWRWYSSAAGDRFADARDIPKPAVRDYFKYLRDDASYPSITDEEATEFATAYIEDRDPAFAVEGQPQTEPVKSLMALSPDSWCTNGESMAREYLSTKDYWLLLGPASSKTLGGIRLYTGTNRMEGINGVNNAGDARQLLGDHAKKIALLVKAEGIEVEDPDTLRAIFKPKPYTTEQLESRTALELEDMAMDLVINGQLREEDIPDAVDAAMLGGRGPLRNLVNMARRMAADVLAYGGDVKDGNELPEVDPVDILYASAATPGEPSRGERERQRRIDNTVRDALGIISGEAVPEPPKAVKSGKVGGKIAAKIAEASKKMSAPAKQAPRTVAFESIPEMGAMAGYIHADAVDGWKSIYGDAMVIVGEGDAPVVPFFVGRVPAGSAATEIAVVDGAGNTLGEGMVEQAREWAMAFPGGDIAGASLVRVTSAMDDGIRQSTISVDGMFDDTAKVSDADLMASGDFLGVVRGPDGDRVYAGVDDANPVILKASAATPSPDRGRITAPAIIALARELDPDGLREAVEKAKAFISREAKNGIPLSPQMQADQITLAAESVLLRRRDDPRAMELLRGSGGDRRFSTAPSPVYRNNVKPVQEALKGYFRGSVPTNIRVVNEPDATWRGVLQGDEILINAARVLPRDVRSTVIHEVGHFLYRKTGIRKAFERFRAVMTPAEKAEVDAIVNGFYSGSAYADEEAMVLAFEGLVASFGTDTRTAWEKFTDLVRRAVKSLFGLPLTRDEAQRHAVELYAGGVLGFENTINPYAVSEASMGKVDTEARDRKIAELRAELRAIESKPRAQTDGVDSVALPGGGSATRIKRNASVKFRDQVFKADWWQVTDADGNKVARMAFIDNDGSGWGLHKVVEPKGVGETEENPGMSEAAQNRVIDAINDNYLAPVDTTESDKIRNEIERLRNGGAMTRYSKWKASEWAKVMAKRFAKVAHHGTPHKVAQFSTDKIGTGEGAQAYGWGLYFAEQQSVADQYRRDLSGFDELTIYTSEGKKKGNDLDDIDMDVAKYLESGERRAGQFKHNTVYYAKQSAVADGRQDVADRLDQYGRDAKVGYEKNTGTLYTVNLNVTDDELLDWDAPLSEQPKKVRVAFAQLDSNTAGADLYREMVASRGMRAEWSARDNGWKIINASGQNIGFSQDSNESTDPKEVLRVFLSYGDSSRETTDSAKVASDALRAIGIKGIRYLDGNSRVGGSGTRNFVIFSGDDVEIVAENGKPRDDGRRYSYASTPEIREAQAAAKQRLADLARHLPESGQDAILDVMGLVNTLDPEMIAKAEPIFDTVAPTDLYRAMKMSKNTPNIRIIEPSWWPESSTPKEKLDGFATDEELRSLARDMTAAGQRNPNSPFAPGPQGATLTDVILGPLADAIGAPRREFDNIGKQLGDALNRGFGGGDSILRASAAAPAALGMGGIGVERHVNNAMAAALQLGGKGIKAAGNRGIVKAGLQASAAIVEKIPQLGAIAKGAMAVGEKVASEFVAHWGVAHEAVMAQKEGNIASARAQMRGKEWLKLLKDGGTSDVLGLTLPKAMAKDPVIQRQIFDYLIGEADLDSLPVEVRAVAEGARETIDILSQRAAAAGIINPETVAKGIGTYLRRFYMKHELNRYGLSGVIGSAIEKHYDRKMLKGKMGLEYTNARLSDAYAVVIPGAKPKPVSHSEDGQWRFDSAAERDAWFASFLDQEVAKWAKKWTGDTAMDLTNARMLIANKYELIEPKTDDELTEMGLIRDPGYVVGKIIATMGHDLAMAEMFQTFAAHPDLVRDEETVGFVRMSKNKALGAISGKWVEENLARDLYEVASAGSDAVKIYDNLMGLWKMGKTVANPATHGRNVIGNFMFADFAGVSPVSIENAKFYRQAWQLVVNRKAAGGVGYAELYDQGVLGADIGSKEFAEAIRTLNMPEETGNFVKDAIGVLSGMANNLYQAEDAMFKTAAYLKARSTGLSPQDAASYVRQWFPYYDEVASSGTVRGLKRTIMPFFSFYAESIRILGNAITHRPATTVKWMAMPAILTQVAFAMMGIDDDDEKQAILAEMRGRQKLGPLQLQFSMLFNWNGELKQLDLTNINPYANSLGMRVEEGRAPDPFLVQLGRSWLSSPIASTAINLFMNVDPFTRKPLIHTEMSKAEATAAVLGQLWNTAAPAPLTGTGVLARTYEAATGGGDVQRSTMERRTQGGDVVRSWTGVDIRNATPQVWRIASRWAERNGVSLGADPSGDTDRVGRARQRVYQAVLNNDVAEVKKELANLEKIGEKDGRKPNAINTAKDFIDLIDNRDPLSALRGEKGESGDMRRARFMAEITPVERASVEKLQAEWRAMKVRAARDIWPAVMKDRIK